MFALGAKPTGSSDPYGLRRAALGVVRILRESAGSNLCVRYSAEADGTLRFRDLVPAARLTRGLLRSAFAAALLAACSPTVDGPVADLGDVVIESIRAATIPTSDGGCDYQTGPFTTFHLAPGHVLCRSTGATKGQGATA